MSPALRRFPIIGREQEVALVRQLIAAGAEAGGGLVVLTGEPGIGKTRLAELTAELAREAGYRVGWGLCWPDGGAPPLWPWQDLLAEVAGPEGHDLLDERAADTPIAPERFARFRAVADLLGRVSTTTPLLLVIEDAHTADPAAVLLARFVVRASVTRRIVMLVTHREPEAEPAALADALADLAHDGAVLRLRGLSTDDVLEMASAAGHDLERDVAGTLRGSTNGNPLLLQELLTTGNASPHALPVAVRRAMARRLITLSAATREVLTAAAVLGPSARPTEVAALAAVTLNELHAARREATRNGLIDEAPGPIAFVHDLARTALLEGLPADALAELHRGAVSVLSATPSASQPEHLIRRAHHALAAAQEAVVDAEAAVAACRDAARSLMRGFAYEAAAELLESAMHIFERDVGRPDPELLVELARATLASGRLLDARPLFRQAAERAQATGDVPALADAALGLGGVWILEHRSLDQQEMYRALLRTALEATREARPDLAARLKTRLAAERLYANPAPDAADFDRMLDAVEEVRATCDAAGVAEALSLLHHTMLGPRFAHDRLALADELVATASGGGDGVLTLMGLLWRTVDLFLLGRPEAERSLVELRQRADALGVATAQLVVREIEVMALIRAGRLDEAEASAAACFSFGTEVGDPDAPAWYGGQLLVIRWLQGRGAELLPLARELARSPSLPTRNQAYDGAVAVLAAEAGELDEARAALERLCIGGLDAMPDSSTLLVTLFEVIEAAAALGDTTVAADAYQRLAPYADLPMLGSLAVVCLGSSERSLGVAARTMGDIDRAVAHFERAIEANRRLGHRTMLAVSQANLAAALQTRPPDTAAGSDEPIASLVRTGEFWEIAAGGERATVPDSVGMATLAYLLAQPGVDVPVERLAGREEGVGSQPVLDRAATESYRRRITDLQEDIDEADAHADIERSARLHVELDALIEELTRTLRPGGRSRAFAGPTERARTAVQKAVRRAVDRIANEAPVLADGLRRTIRTGVACRFEPDDGIPARWEVRTER